MKPALRDTTLVFDETTKKFMGVNLGWDYTAEHEWGINGIKQAFGITDIIQPKRKGLFNKSTKLYGLDRLAIHTIPENFIMFDVVHSKQKYTVLTYMFNKQNLIFNDSGTLKSSEFNKFPFPLWLFDSKKQNAIAAWDYNYFAVCTKFDNKKYLQELYDAFMKLDVVIYVGGSNNPFSNGGLMLMIKSNLEPLYGEDFKKQDLYKEKLEQDVAKTKIVEKLKKANKEYYALEPKYDENGELQFYLNPQEQSKYNYGWFTLNDLLLWIEDKGPIIKQK